MHRDKVAILGPFFGGRMCQVTLRSIRTCCMSVQIEHSGFLCTVADRSDLRCELFAGARSLKRNDCDRISAQVPPHSPHRLWGALSVAVRKFGHSSAARTGNKSPYIVLTVFVF